MRIDFTDHAKERMALRNVKVRDVHLAIAKGKVGKNHHGHFVLAFIPNVRRDYPLQVSFAAENTKTGPAVVVKTVFWKGLKD
jgi:hypothetical protein